MDTFLWRRVVPDGLPPERRADRRRSHDDSGGLGAKEVSEQLIIDAAKYREHQDCKTLVCLVYDPGASVKNPRGIERDFAKLSGNGMEVICVITPRRPLKRGPRHADSAKTRPRSYVWRIKHSAILLFLCIPCANPPGSLLFSFGSRPLDNSYISQSFPTA